MTVIRLQSFYKSICLCWIFFLSTALFTPIWSDGPEDLSSQAEAQSLSKAFKISEVDQVKGRIAILAMHEPRSVEYYVDLRRTLYEAWTLRLIRGIERATGLRLDEGEYRFRVVALVLLMLATTLIFLGFWFRTYRLWGYGFASSLLVAFVAWIALYSGVASLNQFDMRGAHHLQTVLDVTTAKGLEADIFWEWDDFIEEWGEKSADDQPSGISKENQPSSKTQPYLAICWLGIPLGAEELQIETWLNDHKNVPLLQVCLGAHLPKSFQRSVFGDQQPELTWTPDSGQSVCERSVAYQRQAMWQIKDEDMPQVSMSAWHDQWIMYGRADAPPEQFYRWLERGLNQLGRGAWASVDLSDAIALRLDDPGSALPAHLESWLFPTVPESEWKQLDEVLEKHDARLSVAYVPAWLDDGDLERGTLSVDGQVLSERPMGKTYPSSKVRYEWKSKAYLYDNVGQARALAQAENIDLQQHGHTHITPDVQRWVSAKDRDENSDWYREFLGTEQRPYVQRPWMEQQKIITSGKELMVSMFEQQPTIMVPPGHAISWDTSELCFKEGFLALSGRHLVLNLQNQARVTRWIDTTDIIDPVSEHRNFPFVLVMHDRDLHLGGAEKIDQALAFWRSKGVKRMLSLTEMVSCLLSEPTVVCHLDEHGDPAKVVVRLKAMPSEHKGRVRDGLKLKIKLNLPQGQQLKSWPDTWEPEAQGGYFLPLSFSDQQWTLSLKD